MYLVDDYLIMVVYLNKLNLILYYINYNVMKCLEMYLRSSKHNKIVSFLTFFFI